MTRLPQQPGERLDALAHRRVHLRRQARRGLRGRHDRLGALRVRAADVLALVQVPPPARRDVRVRAVHELARRRRRRARRARLRRAGARRAWPSTHQNAWPSLELRRDARRPTSRRPVHAARLLLQDLHPPAASCGRSTRRSCATPPAWACCASSRTTASGAPSTAAATATCSSSAAGSPASRPRSRAAEAGADVVLCDEDTEPGGALLARGRPRARPRARRAGPRARASRSSPRAPALGFFDGLVPVWQGDTLHQVRARPHVVATGVIEQPLVFADNDLPGVMLAGGAHRLAALYGVAPGHAPPSSRRPADRGLDAALALREAGVEIRAVADLRTGAGGDLTERLQELGVEIHEGATVVRASGRKALTGVAVAQVDASGAARGAVRELDCDLLCVSGGTVPATSLLLQGGAKARYDEATARLHGRRVPRRRVRRGRRRRPRGRRRRRAVRRDRRRRGRAGARARRRRRPRPAPR